MTATAQKSGKKEAYSRVIFLFYEIWSGHKNCYSSFTKLTKRVTKRGKEVISDE
jgi:hypothetical protein